MCVCERELLQTQQLHMMTSAGQGSPPPLPRDKKVRQLESTVTFEAVWYFPLMVSVVFKHLIREKGGVIEREERQHRSL